VRYLGLSRHPVFSVECSGYCRVKKKTQNDNIKKMQEVVYVSDATAAAFFTVGIPRRQ
jgi:hypothetical protein